MYWKVIFRKTLIQWQLQRGHLLSRPVLELWLAAGNPGTQMNLRSTSARKCVPVKGDKPSLIGPCSWLPLGGTSEGAQLAMEWGGFSSLPILSSWCSLWGLWFCWPLWGHMLRAAGQFFWAQTSVVLSGSFLTISAPMWFSSPEAEAECGLAVLGFSLCCSSACLQESEALWQSTGPLALRGGHSSVRCLLGFRQFWHGVTLHLQTLSSAWGSTERDAPRGSSGELQGLEQELGDEVLSKEAWVFRSSDVPWDLVQAFCSEPHSADDVTDDRVDAVDEAFCLDRCRMMLHWRAMTSWSHWSNSKTTF